MTRHENPSKYREIKKNKRKKANVKNSRGRLRNIVICKLFYNLMRLYSKIKRKTVSSACKRTRLKCR